MAATSRGPEPGDRAFWTWLGFWLQFLVLALLAIFGAAFASRGAGRGAYTTGLLLTLAALALAFQRLKSHFDGDDRSWSDFLFVDDMADLVVAIPLFTILGLAGLVIARTWRHGSLYAAGIGLFVASALIIFLDIKHVFDRRDRGE